VFRRISRAEADVLVVVLRGAREARGCELGADARNAANRHPDVAGEVWAEEGFGGGTLVAPGVAAGLRSEDAAGVGATAELETAGGLCRRPGCPPLRRRISVDRERHDRGERFESLGVACLLNVSDARPMPEPTVEVGGSAAHLC
jgi:hypothetical protein